MKRAKWIGHICRRNCLVKSVIEEKEMFKGRGDDEKEVSSYSMI
jgi:hypothetical protein